MESYDDVDAWSSKTLRGLEVSQWGIEVETRLMNYGFDVKTFTNRIRSFFFVALDSYYWKTSLKALAAHEEVKLQDEEQYNGLIEKIANSRWYGRGVRLELKTGQRDPVLHEVLTYFRKTQCKIPIFDDAEALRLGIADTINYGS